MRDFFWNDLGRNPTVISCAGRVYDDDIRYFT